jgi:hypothetical protein
VDEDSLNLSRSGAVFVGVVSSSGDIRDSLVRRVGAVSLAVYQEILDLEG